MSLLKNKKNFKKIKLEKNLFLQAFFEQKKEEYGSDVKNFEFMTFIIAF